VMAATVVSPTRTAPLRTQGGGFVGSEVRAGTSRILEGGRVTDFASFVRPPPGFADSTYCPYPV
jgi:hypothetical protein